MLLPRLSRFTIASTTTTPSLGKQGSYLDGNLSLPNIAVSMGQKQGRALGEAHDPQRQINTTCIICVCAWTMPRAVLRRPSGCSPDDPHNGSKQGVRRGPSSCLSQEQEKRAAAGVPPPPPRLDQVQESLLGVGV